MFAVIAFTLFPGFVPFHQRCFAIVGVNGFEPPIALRLLVVHTGIGGPLRTGPGSATLGRGPEDKMGNRCGQQAEPLFAFHQRNFMLTAQRHILADLQEPLGRPVGILEGPDTSLDINP